MWFHLGLSFLCIAIQPLRHLLLPVVCSYRVMAIGMRWMFFGSEADDPVPAPCSLCAKLWPRDVGCPLAGLQPDRGLGLDVLPRTLVAGFAVLRSLLRLWMQGMRCVLARPYVMWFHLGLRFFRIAIQPFRHLLSPHVVCSYRVMALGLRWMVFVGVADDPLPALRPLCAELWLRDAVGCLLVSLQPDRGLNLVVFARPLVAFEILGFSRLLGGGWLDMLASLASLFSTSPFWRHSLSAGR